MGIVKNKWQKKEKQLRHISSPTKQERRSTHLTDTTAKELLSIRTMINTSVTSRTVFATEMESTLTPPRALKTEARSHTRDNGRTTRRVASANKHTTDGRPCEKST